MAKRTVEESSLTSVADAICEYPEFTEAIRFPDGFANDVRKLVSLIRGIIDGTSTEVFIPNGTTKLRAGAFRGMANMTAIHIPEGVESIGVQAFWDCYALSDLKFPVSCTSIKSQAFAFNAKITKLDTYLTSIAGQAFWNTYALRALILRNESSICTLASTNAFEGTKIAAGTGYIYVPRKFLSDTDASKDYRRATNWSAYQFRVLEDYTVDGTVTGELDESKI